MGHDIRDIGAVERSFRDRGYSFDVFIDPPGRQWLGFVHATDEIVVPIAGTVTITIDGVRHDPAPGDEVFIPAGAVHDVVTGPAAGSRWAYGYRKASGREAP